MFPLFSYMQFSLYVRRFCLQASQSSTACRAKRCLKTTLSALDVELHIPLIHAGVFGNWTKVLWQMSLIPRKTLVHLLCCIFPALFSMYTDALYNWKQSFLFSFLFNLFESWFFDEYLAILDLVLETRQFSNSEMHQPFLISPGITGMQEPQCQNTSERSRSFIGESLR